MIAAPGATCDGPKRGWNGWSKPARPGQEWANTAPAKSPERGRSGRSREHPCARSAKRRWRQACSAALRRSEFVSRASSMSSTCSGRQLVTTAGSRCCDRAPAALHVAQSGPRAFRLSLRAPMGAPALSIQASHAGGKLAASGFPGRGRWRVHAQAWQNRIINRSAPFLRPPFPLGKRRLPAWR